MVISISSKTNEYEIKAIICIYIYTYIPMGQAAWSAFSDGTKINIDNDILSHFERSKINR